MSSIGCRCRQYKSIGVVSGTWRHNVAEVAVA